MNNHAERGSETGTALSTTVRSAELATGAAASAAKAKIEAAYTVALHRPRDIDQVRDRLLTACKRPGFADAALYRKPVGGGKHIDGMSVRFAEEAARLMGNLQCQDQTIYDDPQMRVVEVMVTDLETNYVASKQVTVEKTVERKSNKGRDVIAERVNSYGDKVYIVVATEDELFNKQGTQIAKAKRNLLLDMLPGDIMAECRELIERTLRGEIEADPEAAKKKLLDSFSGIGVKPTSLKKHLGHDVSECSPKEIQELRSLFMAIKNGETTWAEITAGQRDVEDAPAKPSAFADGKKADAEPAKKADDDQWKEGEK